MPRPVVWFQWVVAVGLALRAFHYLRCPSVWHDEAALIVNVLGLSFRDMLGPLLHAEAAPPLFLMIERAVVLLLGEDEYALRLVPFLASCLALALFANLAWRTLDPWAGVLAVGLFAVSDRLLWHACEAKPYALDVLIAVASAWWLARTETWPPWKRCLPVAVLAPVALWVSFPACFVSGGLLLALAPLARKASWGDRAAFGLLGVVIGLAFGTLALGPAAAQRNSDMEACWAGHFPDWSRPWTVPLWAIAGTFEVARYCLLPLGQLILVFAVVGAVSLWRTRPGLVVALAAPLGLALVAALLHKYPYGGSRLEVFAAPALCLLGAEGVRRCAMTAAKRSRVLAVLVVLVAAVPFGQAAYRTVKPWERAAHDEATAYLLRHRAEGDAILVNHWEDEYYLRHAENWRSWTGAFEPRDLTAGRVWVVLSLDRESERFPFPPPAGWRVAEAKTFKRVTVFRLERE
jgi:hypothetical protein